MEKQHQKREKIKERELFTHLQNQSICPGSVAAYHPSLSSLGLGFKFRPGRPYFILKAQSYFCELVLLDIYYFYRFEIQLLKLRCNFRKKMQGT